MGQVPGKASLPPLSWVHFQFSVNAYVSGKSNLRDAVTRETSQTRFWVHRHCQTVTVTGTSVPHSFARRGVRQVEAIEFALWTGTGTEVSNWMSPASGSLNFRTMAERGNWRRPITNWCSFQQLREPALDIASHSSQPALFALHPTPIPPRRSFVPHGPTVKDVSDGPDFLCNRVVYRLPGIGPCTSSACRNCIRNRNRHGDEQSARN